MKVLLLKKDGIVHKVSALDKNKVQAKLDAGFVEVGFENLEPAEDITVAVAEAVKAAIDALDIDKKIADAVAEAVKALQTPVKTPEKTPKQAPSNKK